MDLQNLKNENLKTISKTSPEPEIESIEKIPADVGETAPEAPAEIIAPEIGAEQQPVKIEEEKEGFLDDTIDALKQKLKMSKKKPTQIPQVRDELTLKVENLLEEDLKDAYKEMTPVQQQEFKIKGEKTAFEICELLRRGKVKVKKIFMLILEWLKLLPGVNRFFLEQEAKIKADKIIALKKISDNSR